MQQILERITYCRLRLVYYLKGVLGRLSNREISRVKYVKVHYPHNNYNIEIDLNDKVVNYLGRISAGMRGQYRWMLSESQSRKIHQAISKFSVLSLPRMKERPDPRFGDYVGFHRVVLTESTGYQTEIHFNIDERRFFENQVYKFLSAVAEITGLSRYTIADNDMEYNFFLVKMVDADIYYAVSANSEEIAVEVVCYHYLYPTNFSLDDFQVTPITLLKQSPIEVNYPYVNVWDQYIKQSPRIDLRKNPETQRWEVLTLERYYEAFGFYDAQLEMVILILGLEHPMPGQAKPPYCP